MGIKIENTKIQYEAIKRKRDLIIALIYVIAFILIALFLILYLQVKLKLELISGIYFFLIAGYFLFIILVKPRLVDYSMQVKYLAMLIDDLKPVKITKKIYTKSWLDKFKNIYNFSVCNYEKYMIFYKFTNQLEEIRNKGKVFLAVVVSKVEDLDFYADDINKILEDLKNQEKRVTKQLILQFKKIEKFKEEKIEEFKEIICFSVHSHYIINIPVAYFVDNNTIYYLRPLKKFPNKYYFYMNELIKDICGIKGDYNE